MLKNYRDLTIKTQITLENGDILAITEELIEQKGTKVKYSSRNLYKFQKYGKCIWQIKSDGDIFGNHFISIYRENDEYRAYRWDGGVYRIDPDKGTATPLYLAR